MNPVEKKLLTEQVRAQGRCRVRVGGFCMRPVILDRALVQVQAQPLANLKAGDIVAYFIGSKLLVHRLIACEGCMLTLRGDSDGSVVHQIPFSDILGIVAEIENPTLLYRLFRKAFSVWQKLTNGWRMMETAPAESGQSR
jgi:hypothetical protein